MENTNEKYMPSDDEYIPFEDDNVEKVIVQKGGKKPKTNDLDKLLGQKFIKEYFR